MTFGLENLALEAADGDAPARSAGAIIEFLSGSAVIIGIPLLLIELVLATPLLGGVRRYRWPGFNAAVVTLLGALMGAVPSFLFFSAPTPAAPHA